MKDWMNRLIGREQEGIIKKKEAKNKEENIHDRYLDFEKKKQSLQNDMKEELERLREEAERLRRQNILTNTNDMSTSVWGVQQATSGYIPTSGSKPGVNYGIGGSIDPMGIATIIPGQLSSQKWTMTQQQNGSTKITPVRFEDMSVADKVYTIANALRRLGVTNLDQFIMELAMKEINRDSTIPHITEQKQPKKKLDL